MGGGASKPQPKRGKSDANLSTKSNKESTKEDVVIERRPPLTTVEEISKSEEALSRITTSLGNNPPGTVGRWQNILKAVNILIPPTEEEPDPLRIEMDLPMLRQILRDIYENVSFAVSDGIILMRTHFPMIFKDHTLMLAKQMSQTERDAKGMAGDMWAYGELDHEVFATIYEKITKAYGIKPKGTFCDLGSGAGPLVYAAAFIGDFSECIGVEYITALLEAGERKLSRWNRIKKDFPQSMQLLKMTWNNENYLEFDAWTKSTFITAHWTTLPKALVEQASLMMDQCAEGTMVVTFTHELVNSNFDLLVKDTCRVSWGEADFFVYEKMTPAKPKSRKK